MMADDHDLCYQKSTVLVKEYLLWASKGLKGKEIAKTGTRVIGTGWSQSDPPAASTANAA
jgi:hypothetical protein